MALFPKRESLMHSLREVIASSRTSEDLDQLPNNFARVLQQFEASDLHPGFRHDIYQLLNGSVEIALALVDQTYPIDRATVRVSSQLTILARILEHLQQRPTTTGYAILIPEQAQLFGNYATREEAEGQLGVWRALGMSRNCTIVPTQVISQHAIQPRAVVVQQEPPATPMPIPVPAPVPEEALPAIFTPIAAPTPPESPISPPVCNCEAREGEAHLLDCPANPSKE